MNFFHFVMITHQRGHGKNRSKPYSDSVYHFVTGITQVSIFIYFMDFSNCNLEEVVFVRVLKWKWDLETCHQEHCVYLYEASHIGTQEYLYII